MINVTHIITDLDIGGAEMMLYKLLSNTDNKQLSHTVISLMGKGTLGESIEKLGSRVYYLDIQRGWLPGVSSLLKLRQVIRIIRPDIVQGWMYHGNLASLVASIFGPGRMKVNWNIRQSLYDLKDEKILTSIIIRLCAWLSSKPDRIIYNSIVSRIQHEKIGYTSSKSMMLPNGFDCKIFSPDKTSRTSFRNSLGLNHNSFLIGLIGRYHAMKDHDTFLQAAAIVKKKYPNVHFILAGKDIDLTNQKLVSMVHDNSLSDSVHLLGERDDIPKIIPACDIVCSSSWSEAFPNVIGEAMACGVPCIVTDVGDSAQIVGETGVVVPPQDPISLANGFEKMMIMEKRQRLEMGIAARKRIKTFFSIEYITEQYEQLYHNMLKA